MVPPPLWPPLCTLPPGPGPPRFVCYCEGEGGGPGEQGGFNLCVTDAAELWSTCFTPDGLAALKARFGLSAAEDIALRFRAACERQAVTLTVQEDRASLTLSGGPSALELDLSKVPGPEAASRLQALMLGLAERVCSLEQRLAAAAAEMAPSPRKSAWQAGPHLFLPDPDPQRGGPGPGVKRRCPGESLINPGFKRCSPAPRPSCAQGPAWTPPAPPHPAASSPLLSQ
ncbi:protein PAXX isoform X1 [Odocoileus virginianus]|uniref:Protein PAXX isoform X1 n=1 Tax=Odocoileus virginianus TaxID=9874 RepID=A0ABM4H9M3_ODOVR